MLRIYNADGYAGYWGDTDYIKERTPIDTPIEAWGERTWQGEGYRLSYRFNMTDGGVSQRRRI